MSSIQQTTEEPVNSRIEQIHAQVSDVRTSQERLQVMQNNVQQMLERGDRLDNLDGRAEALNQSSEDFKLSARRIKRHLCRNNMKWSIIITVGALVLVLIVIFVVLNDLGVFRK